MVRVPILTYHATNVDGNEYRNNDHVAFAADLRQIDQSGHRVIPLVNVVDALLRGTSLPERAVAIALDDGTDLDFRDRMHPTHGPQRGMLNILRDFIDDYGPDRQPGLHATAFVIASPSAREELDRKSMIGAGWWTDDWWTEAVDSGLMGIGNHSWDHNHAVLASPIGASSSGTFMPIDTLALADLEIRQARDYIDAVAPNNAANLFAYPFGEPNEYLVREYLPRGERATGVRAAFVTKPAHVTAGSNRWTLPRYVCGADWKTPEELAYILSRV